VNYPSPQARSGLLPTACLSHAFNRKDWLPPRSDCLWRIEAGVIRTVTWDGDGVVATLGLWGAGEVVGQPLSRIQPYRMECLTVVRVSEQRLLYGLPCESQDCELQDCELQDWLSYAQRHEELLNILHCRQIPLRLLQLLEWLSQRFGRTVKQGQLIDLCLTHQELAETIGTTRVTVTRLLRQLEQEGRICKLGRSLILPIELASA
jgi:CRP-like cAMP-binding protein